MQGQRVVKEEWSPQDNLEQAKHFKTQGNIAFNKQSYKEALRAYHKAILHLAGIIDKSSSVAMYTSKVATQSITTQANGLKFTIYLNMAQIYISEQKPQKGLNVLNQAKNIKTNTKLFYRRAICLMRLSEFEQAKVDLSKVLDLDPSLQKDVQKLRNDLKALEKEQDKKSKALYQNFFK